MTLLSLQRAIVVGGFLDNRTPDCDYAGLWVGQVKTENGWKDSTEFCKTRQQAFDELEWLNGKQTQS